MATTRPQQLSASGNAILAPRWFIENARFPARVGNLIRPLVDGQVTFEAIRHAIVQAEATVHIAIWWLEPGLRLCRDTSGNGEPLSALLEACGARGVQVRIIAWNLPPLITTVINFAPLPPPFNTLPRGNPRDKSDLSWLVQVKMGLHPNIRIVFDSSGVVGSHHQKAIVIDGRWENRANAFVMGMNLRRTDWDTSDHSYDSDLRDDGEGPRHDVAVHIRGPVAFDVEQNFVERWNAIQPTTEQLPAPENFDLTAVRPPRRNTVTAQVLRTMPNSASGDPYPKAVEADILRAYIQAINNAQNFIYVEDQYFRLRELADALVARKRVRPELRLIVVTMSISGFIPTSANTANAINSVTAAFGPSFFQLMTCRKTWLFGANFRPISLHAKIMIVDDVFLIIGSANLHGRGMRHDSEMVVAALAPEEARNLRIQLWSEHLAAARGNVEDTDNGLELWQRRAAENAKLHASDDLLVGHILPLTQDTFWPLEFPEDLVHVPQQDGPEVA